MSVIKVPKPPKSAYNPGRPVSGLLKMQIEHLQEAERRLPLRYRSEIYPNAIRTEGEAAAYIHAVTSGIHKAHDDAAALRAKLAKKRNSSIGAVDKSGRARQKKKSKSQPAKKRKR